jgi:hypothetical protein
MDKPRTRCEVCGSSELITTFSRIDMQQVCATCESTYSTYFRKDGAPFSYPAAWGKVVAVEVETSRLTDAYAELHRRTGRLGEVCHQVLEGRLNEVEGLSEIEKQFKEIVEGHAPGYPVEQAVYYIFSDGQGNVRRGRIAKGYFDTPRKVAGGGVLDAYHYWVVDVLPSE